MKQLLAILILLLAVSACKKNEESVPDRVPEWSKTAIWYQIFPERFYNGDPSNDPKVIDRAGAWPYKYPDKIPTHPWTSDWYKLQPWEKDFSNEFYRNVQIRRYGGDLQGIIEKLDYLKELSVTALYINPIFESPSLHKYDATMYRHIDNNFGPDPEGDRKIWESEDPQNPTTWKWTSADKLFLQLIQKAHKRNIKVVIDGVFNHVGRTFWAFEDLVKNQQNSKYKDWFTVTKWDNPATPENEFDYEGWVGVKELPELKEDENGLVKPVADHIHNIVRRWMDPNGDGNPEDGIDGWRLDVAEMVSLNFWKTFRTWIKEINPNAYSTGEIWWEDWDHDVMINASPWLQGDSFDGVMNYRFARAAKMYIVNRENKNTPTAFIDSLKNIYHDYHPDNVRAAMNLISSHDTERFSTLIKNPKYNPDHLRNVGENPEINIEKPTDEEYQKLKLVVALQVTLPGAPMIYYGDEAGMWGADDPDERKPMVWQNMKYEDETTHPLGKHRNRDKVEFNFDLFEWYKLMMGIRSQNSVLALSDVKVFYTDDEKYILGYKRSDETGSIFVLVNGGDKNADAVIDASTLGGNNLLTDLVTDKQYGFDAGKFNFSLAPYSVMILK